MYLLQSQIFFLKSIWGLIGCFMVFGLEGLNMMLDWIFPAHPKRDAGLAGKSPDTMLVFMSHQGAEQVDKHSFKQISQYFLVKFLGIL